MARSTCTGKDCGQVFSSVSGFDLHQRQRQGIVVCMDPAELGLEKIDGIWRAPASDTPVNYGATQREERYYTCRTCGGDFQGPGGRGRPPVTCNREGCGGKGLAV